MDNYYIDMKKTKKDLVAELHDERKKTKALETRLIAKENQYDQLVKSIGAEKENKQCELENRKSDFQNTCEFLKYSLDALQNAGLTREEAFTFIITGLKGGMKI